MRNVLVRKKLLQQGGPRTVTHAAPHFPNEIRPDFIQTLLYYYKIIIHYCIIIWLLLWWKFDSADQLLKWTRMKKPLAVQGAQAAEQHDNCPQTQLPQGLPWSDPAKLQPSLVAPSTGNSFSPSSSQHHRFAVIGIGNHSLPRGCFQKIIKNTHTLTHKLACLNYVFIKCNHGGWNFQLTTSCIQGNETLQAK